MKVALKFILTFSFLISAFSCANSDKFPNGFSGDGQIFPHSSDISDGKVHGELAYETSFSTCLLCHSEGSSRYGSRTSCFECHTDGFAHTSPTWANPDEHGPAAIEAGPMVMCATCHGPTLEGGDFANSCYDTGCHAGSPYPHNIRNFRYGSVHGPRTSQTDFLICLNCHESSIAQSKGIVACADCHHNSDRNCLSCHPLSGDDD